MVTCFVPDFSTHHVIGHIDPYRGSGRAGGLILILGLGLVGYLHVLN